jgi:hypothetical protein
LNPKIVDGEGYFKYQKVFGDDVYMASGMLELPALTGFKPEKSSKDNAYVSHRPHTVMLIWAVIPRRAGSY